MSLGSTIKLPCRGARRSIGPPSESGRHDLQRQSPWCWGWFSWSSPVDECHAARTGHQIGIKLRIYALAADGKLLIQSKLIAPYCASSARDPALARRTSNSCTPCVKRSILGGGTTPGRCQSGSILHAVPCSSLLTVFGWPFTLQVSSFETALCVWKAWNTSRNPNMKESKEQCFMITGYCLGSALITVISWCEDSPKDALQLGLVPYGLVLDEKLQNAGCLAKEHQLMDNKMQRCWQGSW